MFIDVMRRKKKNVFSSDAGEIPEVPDWTHRPERSLEENDREQVLEKALFELPAEQREVFLLRQQSLSFKEISDIQKCPLNTVLGRMHYAVRNLKKLITGKVN